MYWLLLSVLTLTTLANNSIVAHFSPFHSYTELVSRELSSSIKIKLYGWFYLEFKTYQ